MFLYFNILKRFYVLQHIFTSTLFVKNLVVLHYEKGEATKIWIFSLKKS